MSKPKKIKSKMPAPLRRNLIHFEHITNTPASGALQSKKDKERNKRFNFAVVRKENYD